MSIALSEAAIKPVSYSFGLAVPSTVVVVVNIVT